MKLLLMSFGRFKYRIAVLFFVGLLLVLFAFKYIDCSVVTQSHVYFISLSRDGIAIGYLSCDQAVISSFVTGIAVYDYYRGTAMSDYSEYYRVNNTSKYLISVKSGSQGGLYKSSFIITVSFWIIMTSYILLLFSMLRSVSVRHSYLCRNHCPRCAYNLQGNTSQICSECGYDLRARKIGEEKGISTYNQETDD